MTAPAIRAIETRWKGWRFRSRCEARWAVFFEHLPIAWEYEPEGFHVATGDDYLPDFLVAHRFYVEVKGDSYFDGRGEWEKWSAFAEGTRRELLVVFGTPSLEARCLLLSPPVTLLPCVFDEIEDSPPVEFVHHDVFARIATVAFH